MGAWGAGILQDDSAMDIIDDYRILLGYKVPNEEAYELVKNYYYPDFKGQDDEDIFWFALAIYQLRNGILMDEVKKKAQYFLKNPISLEVWKESGKSVYQNRLKVLEKLKEELENPSVTEPKKIPKPPAYYSFKTKYKEGDLLAVEITEDEKGNIEESYIGKYCLMRVIKVEKIPLTRIKPELDYFSYPIVVLYKWVGEKIPEIDKLSELALGKDCLGYELSEDDNSEKYITIIGNNIDYKKENDFSYRNIARGGYCPLRWDICHYFKKLREKGEKFEALGD